jgi:hypothetical protein
LKRYYIFTKFLGETEIEEPGYVNKEDAETALENARKATKAIMGENAFKMGLITKEVPNQDKGDSEELIALRESNGWENETWRFWIKQPETDEEKEILERVKALFEKVGTMDQKIGNTSFFVEDNFPKPENTIDWENVGYTYFNTKMDGYPKKESLAYAEKLNQEDLLKLLYKCGTKKLFEEIKPEAL